MKITINIKRKMMSTAHEITRTTIRTYGGDYRATFSISLKIVHATIKKWDGVHCADSSLHAALERLSVEIYDTAVNYSRKKEQAENGIVEMHYSEYKNKYSDCKTVQGSYDKKTKTIQVIVGGATTTKDKTVASSELINTDTGFVFVTHYTDGSISRSIPH